MGFDYAWNSINELVDSAVSADVAQSLEKVILRTPGVIKIHQLRTRLMGHDIFIDVHVLVSPFISVSEGHYIAQQVHRQLMKKMSRVKDVTVHIDSEDDEENCPSLALPSRSLLETKFFNPLKNDCPALNSWALHYLDGKLTVDLFIDKKNDSKDKLINAINTYQEGSSIHTIRVYEIIDEITLAKKRQEK